jgi:hypothetical protein
VPVCSVGFVSMHSQSEGEMLLKQKQRPGWRGHLADRLIWVSVYFTNGGLLGYLPSKTTDNTSKPHPPKTTEQTTDYL